MPVSQQPSELNEQTNKNHNNPEKTYVDVLGIGFGPSNLSLAIAIEEHNQGLLHKQKTTAKFFETKSQFSWHNGMLLPGTTMQISFLKDLVSLRTPTSPYTFLNYLHDQNRLSDFINLKTFFPTRQEFYQYLHWAANRISLPVTYNVEATRIDWDSGHFTVTTRNKDITSKSAEPITAQNIVIGAGLRPLLPEGISSTNRVFHNHELFSNLDKLSSRPNKRFLVVGSGQSAAEVAAYLHDTYKDSEVHASFHRFGYTTSDDTPYANRIFDPQSVDEFYSAPSELKQRLLKYHWSTNYSAVDEQLINDLYHREYDETIRGVRRLHIHRTTEIENLNEDNKGVTVTLRDLGGRNTTQIKADAIVFATGYKAFNIRDLLGPSIDLSEAFDGDLPVVKRNYSLHLPKITGKIYLNGGIEHSHGLTSPLLSTVAIRAEEILTSITAKNR